MFEFDKYDKRRHAASTAIPVPILPPPQPVEKAALVLWGEHCIECAAPDCFTTCDLYERRSDGRCRRMPFGMAPNHNIAGSRGPGAEVVLGKWAKFEARGNTTLISNRALRVVEHLALRTSSSLNVLGALLATMLRQERWNYLSFALGQWLMDTLRKYGPNTTPDGFLIDVYNPMTQQVTLTLTMSVPAPKLDHATAAPADLPRPYYKRITLASGHNRQFVPYREFRDIIESKLPFNISLTPDSDCGYHLVVRTLDLIKLSTVERTKLDPPPVRLKGSTKRASSAKCVVFDLDNTLWQGVLLETDAVQLFPHILVLLRKLDERGILLSLASKNAHSHAMAKLRELGIDEYFIFPRINWAPKSESIRQIAKDIDIGLDTFVFVDDNAFELEEVGQALPMVECIHVADTGALLSHPRLQGNTSSEARNRRKMYRDAMVRTEAQGAFGDDYIAFLKSCQIHLRIRPEGPDDSERVAELVQRTNQLNFSGHKYSRDELFKLSDDNSIDRYVLICDDKFGSYGCVGFCMARRVAQTVRVLDLMLSCRVQGKLIESALFDYLCNQAGAPPANAIEIEFKRTERNGPAQQVLAKLGFDIAAEGSVRRQVGPDTFAVDFIDTLNDDSPTSPFRKSKLPL